MSVPAQTPARPPIAPERLAKVDVARRGWISRLVDMSRRNNLLFHRDTKASTLDLTGANADAMRRLLQSGRTGTDGAKLAELSPTTGRSTRRLPRTGHRGPRCHRRRTRHQTEATR